MILYCFPRGFRQILKNPEHDDVIRYLFAISRSASAAEISAATNIDSHRVSEILKVHVNSGAVIYGNYVRMPGSGKVRTYYLASCVAAGFEQLEGIA